ncbi:MAG: tetratricopeptide repeat protein [Clostridiales bacterium]|nr:tetratricopeptide repeat protein [Clostridiales bacterium]
MSNRLDRIVCIAAIAVLLLCGCGADTQAKEEYRTYGIACLNDGDYEAAIEAFGNALDESVGRVSELDLDICYYKAEAQYLNGDYEDALETYTAIINYNGDARAYYLRGCLYYATGVENEAGQGAQDFDAALDADPDNYELYIGIYEALTSVETVDGISVAVVNLTDEEIEGYLRTALEIKGSDAEDYMYRGRIYYMLGEFDNALDYLEEAAEKGETEAYYYLTMVYEAKGDSELADAAFDNYINSDNLDALGLYEIGVTQMENGEYEAAISCFTLGLAQTECDCEQELRRGMIFAYEYMGDFETAKEWAADYVQEYPDDEDMAKEYTFLTTR